MNNCEECGAIRHNIYYDIDGHSHHLCMRCAQKHAWSRPRAALAEQPAAADALPASDSDVHWGATVAEGIEVMYEVARMGAGDGDAPDRDAAVSPWARRYGELAVRSKRYHLLAEEWAGKAQAAEARAEAAEAALKEARMLLDTASALRTLTTDTLASLLPDCDPAMPYAAFLDKVAGQIRLIGEDAIDARAALRQEREAHRALVTAARATADDSFLGEEQHGDHVLALRDALAALPEATAPEAEAGDDLKEARDLVRALLEDGNLIESGHELTPRGYRTVTTCRACEQAAREGDALKHASWCPVDAAKLAAKEWGHD